MTSAHGLSLVASESLPAIGAALVVILAAIGAGGLSFRLGRLIFGSEADDTSVAECAAAGFASLGTILGIVAWTGLALGPATIVLTLAAGAVGIATLLQRRATFTATRFSWPLLLLIPPVGCAFALALAPVNSPDELIYKLAVPHAYLLEGRMFPLPLSSHSYLALSYELASLAALVLSGGIAAKLAHFAIYVATLRIIHAAVARREPRAALWSTIVVAWTPALAVIAGWAWSDWGVIALVVVALDRYVRWEDGDNPADLAASAVAAGCAASIKYTALPFLALLMLVALWRLRGRAQLLVRAAVVVVLFGGFFYVRNIAWSGSPVAPMLTADAPPLSHYRAPGIVRAWTDFFGGVYVHDREMIDESAGVVLPLACIAGLWGIVVRRKLRHWQAIILLQIPIVVSMAPVTRNLMPAFVPLALAGTVAAWRWITAKPRVAQIAAAAGIAVALAWQGTIVARVIETYDVARYLAGDQTEAEYIRGTRRFAAPYDWIAQRTPATARVLLLGENRTFYLQRPFVAASNFDGPRIAKWLAAMPDSAALDAELRRQHVTHVVIHRPWYLVGERLTGVVEREFVLEVSPATHRMLMNFLSTRCAQRYRDDEYLIYEIVR